MHQCSIPTSGRQGVTRQHFPITIVKLLRLSDAYIRRYTNHYSFGSDNGLLPGGLQAIIWTNAEILLIEPLGTNFSEHLIEIHIFSFKTMHMKMWSMNWRPFCIDLKMLQLPFIIWLPTRELN